MITSKVFGAFLALSTVAPVTYQALNHEPPVTVVSAEARGVGFPGRDLLIGYEVDGQADCPTQVERSFIDATGIVTTFKRLEMNHVGSIGARPQLYKLHIPFDASDGAGTYRVTFVFRCNLVQRAFPVTRTFDIPVTIERNST